MIFRYFQCLHLMYSKVALMLVYLGTQVQAQIIRKLNYLPDYLSVSYDYGKSKEIGVLQPIFPDYVISCDYAFTYQKELLHTPFLFYKNYINETSATDS